MGTTEYTEYTEYTEVGSWGTVGRSMPLINQLISKEMRTADYWIVGILNGL